MATTASNSKAPPPSPQEVSRKLSLYSAAKKANLPPSLNNSSTLSAVSTNTGAESDSDVSEILAPHSAGPPTANQLDAIAERNAVSDDESESDDGGASVHYLNNPPGRGDEIVLKSGYLWKKGERRKTWKKRWFVLRPYGLSLYKNSAEYQLLRLVDLSQIHSTTPVNLKRRDHAFGLVSPARTFYLQASSDAEVNDWVQAIEAARKPGTSAPIAIPGRSGAGDVPPTLAITPSPPSFGFHHTGGASSASESDDNAYAPTISSKLPPASPSQSRMSAGNPAASSIKSSTASTTTSTKEPIMQGYLMKCGSKRKIWRKRWFVLNNTALVYYSSHMSNKPHRTIALRDVLDAFEYEMSSQKHQPPVPQSAGHTQSKEPSSPTTPAPPSFAPTGDAVSSGKLTFKIVCTKRALLLCAPQEEDELKWIGAIRALAARRQQVPSTSFDSYERRDTWTHACSYRSAWASGPCCG
ncbi:pleckstrin-like protein [Flagelloscypha sp. PMI_526]|nr:pleckstrin-like protein [Flagelloscypha sp. PMI_526]